jgi:hypothetical protein
MQFKKSVMACIFAISSVSLAAPITAQPGAVNQFLDSVNPGWNNSTYYTNIGTHRFLKYSTKNNTNLADIDMQVKWFLSMSGKTSSYKMLNGIPYEQISEIGTGTALKPQFYAQCVGFAKAMTGSTLSTSQWKKLDTNAIAINFPNGKIGSISLASKLPVGAMIVNFNNSTPYGNLSTNHTAIVLSVATSNGVITGANVVAQNADNGNMISKYFLPWNSGSTLTSLSLKNYHVIDQ